MCFTCCNLLKSPYHYPDHCHPYLSCLVSLILRRQGGLKPLSRQTQPLQIKTNPYNKLVNGNKRGGAVAANMNEPLYRKARLAQHLKEMAKIPQNDRFTNRSMMVFDDMDDEDTTRSAPAAFSDYAHSPKGVSGPPRLGGAGLSDYPHSSGVSRIGNHSHTGSQQALVLGGTIGTGPGLQTQGASAPPFDLIGFNSNNFARPSTRTNSLYSSVPK